MVALAIGCFAFGLGVTWVLIPWLVRWNIALDHPNELRKRHRCPTPRLGGIALMLVFSLITGFTLLVSDRPLPYLQAFLLVGTALFALGLLDDFRPLPSKGKLVGQVGVASGAVLLGLRIETLPALTGGVWHLDPTLSVLISIAWLVTIPNLINLIDGMDGLAGGISLIICLSLATLGLTAQGPDLLDLSFITFALAGSLVGFLRANAPPARLFLGDGGAYFLGIFLAAAPLTVSFPKTETNPLIPFLVLSLAVPIIDSTCAFGRRALRGLPVMRGDAEHLHHRLQARGYSPARVLLVLLSATLVMTILGTVFFHLGWGNQQWWTIVFLLPPAVILIPLAGYLSSWSDLPASFQRTLR
ncbi:MAG: MraY family glycosyltransferase, partial [Verrucomicrobiota bacterium]